MSCIEPRHSTPVGGKADRQLSFQPVAISGYRSETPAGVSCKYEGNPGLPRGTGVGELAAAAQPAAQLAEPEAPGEVGESWALPGWPTVAGPRLGTPTGGTRQLLP